MYTELWYVMCPRGMLGLERLFIHLSFLFRQQPDGNTEWETHPSALTQPSGKEDPRENTLPSRAESSAPHSH